MPENKFNFCMTINDKRINARNVGDNILVDISNDEKQSYFSTEMNVEEFSCMLYLSTFGDDPNKDVETMYDIVEQVLVNCPQECRPIP